METGFLPLIKTIYIYIRFQRCPNDIAVTDVPEFLFRIPTATGRLCLGAVSRHGGSIMRH